MDASLEGSIAGWIDEWPVLYGPGRQNIILLGAVKIQTADGSRIVALSPAAWWEKMRACK